MEKPKYKNGIIQKLMSSEFIYYYIYKDLPLVYLILLSL